MNKTLITSLAASIAMGGVALAQMAPGPATTTPPATTQPGMGTTTGANASGTTMQSEGGFYTYQAGNQMLGSGLMGARVMGAGGENIGEVDDLLLDRNGQVMAVVVGVGGFLGIGEKDVAIGNDQLQFVLAQDAAATTGTTAATGTTTMAPAAGTSTTPMAPTGTTAAPGTTTAGTNTMAPVTGTAGTTGMRTGAAMGYGWNWAGERIDHVQVQFTREQLEGAPAFKYAG